MEVHQHTHTPRKKWTHYFWEFLMLFLAVFCGFLAENQREHFVEHRRENQFIVSLMKDMQMDTSWLNIVTIRKEQRISDLDSALFSFKNLKGNELPASIYRNLRRSMNNLYFYPHNGTITQLRNSGGMRLIRDRKTVELIELYNRQLNRQESHQGLTKDFLRDFVLLLNKFVSGKDAYQVVYDTTSYKLPDLVGTVRINRLYLDEFIHECINIRKQIEGDISANNTTLGEAKKLMVHIRMKYQIE